MKKSSLLITIIFLSLNLQAQIPTFSNDVATIIFNNCTNCHRPGNIAPFSLTNYDEVSGAAASIFSAVNNRIMPPWPPDPAYRHFQNERVLTDLEIQTINDWISFGMPVGDTSLLPSLPAFTEGSEIGVPDIQYNLPHYTLTSPVNEYRCFVIPSQFSQEVFVKAIEFLPGNKQIDHHAVIFWDTSGVCQQLDDSTIETGYTSFSSFAGTDNAQKIAIWVPGSPPLILPQNFGYRIPANADIIVQMHYPSGSVGFVDSSKLNIFFQSGVVNRNVNLKATINIVNITDGPLIIPADSIKTFHAQNSFPITTSIIAVMPHMHLIGKSTFSYAIEPTGDTIKLVSVPNWNFYWQGFYVYDKLLKMPANTIVKSEFTYDNTSSNLLNPNYPPQTIYYGNGSENEMLVTAFLTVPYKHGDENILLSNGHQLNEEKESTVVVYPNPGNGNFVLNFNFKQSRKIVVAAYNVEGVLVKKIFYNTIEPGSQFRIFDLTEWPSGIYFLKISGEQISEVKKITIIH